MNRRDLKIAFLLFLLGTVLTFAYFLISDIYLSIISHSHPQSSFTSLSKNRVVKGSSVKGEITAVENYLGIISVRFNNSIDSNDVVIFRIKEKNAPNWYYENTYKAHYLYATPFFPFGFPVIKDSKNKNYIFQIDSTNGKQLLGFSISHEKPNLVSRYQIPRSLVLNTQFLPKFIFAKIQYNLGVEITQRYICLYFLPFMLFLLWKLILDKYLPDNYKLSLKKESKKLLQKKSLFIFFLLFLDVTLLTKPYYFIIGFILLCWLFIIQKYKYSSKDTLYVALILLFSCPLLFMFQLDIVAQKAAMWFFIFMCIGLIQSTLEFKKIKL